MNAGNTGGGRKMRPAPVITIDDDDPPPQPPIRAVDVFGDFGPLVEFCRKKDKNEMSFLGVLDPAKVERAITRVVRIWMDLGVTYAQLKLQFEKATESGERCHMFCRLCHQVETVLDPDNKMDPVEIVYLMHRHLEEVFDAVASPPGCGGAGGN